MTRKEVAVFSQYYENNFWKDPESASGPGSSMQATSNLRPALEKALVALGIRSLVDAPCGDMNWMRHLDYKFDSYIGVDIVPTLVEKLRQGEFPSSHRFQTGNIGTDILPRADALFCRDCLVHLPFELIHDALKNWKLAGFTYLMLTTFPRMEQNTDCSIGGWRPLNMERAPFNLPPPLMILPEFPLATFAHSDKAIGVWEVASL